MHACRVDPMAALMRERPALRGAGGVAVDHIVGSSSARSAFSHG